MIGPDYVRTMSAYNAEMNRRVNGAALRLPDHVRRANGGVFWRSLHGTLSHLLWADRTWLSRFGVSEAPREGLRDSGKLVDDFDTLWAQRQACDGVLIEWADGLGLDDLAGEITWFSGAVGRTVSRPVSLVVVHIFNHQTHHRGQAHALITRAGETTGDTDLPFVLMD